MGRQGARSRWRRGASACPACWSTSSGRSTCASRALDEHGEPIVIEASGLEARVIQHEIDHLDGVLILDRTAREQRKEAMRALREAAAGRVSGRSRPASPPVRTVFLGTSAFAAGVLERLADSPHRPALVVTRPDRPRGRGRRAAPAAGRRGRPGARDRRSTSRPRSTTSRRRARIAAARPEVVCVCAFGALIKEPLLSDYQMLNVHPSLLPRWRGAAPIERAIMAGDELTGVSIMRVDRGARQRAGVRPGAASRSRPDDTYGTLARAARGARRRAAGAGARRAAAVRRAGRGARRPTRTRSPPRTASSIPRGRRPSSSAWSAR